ncbi:MAG: 23S rRNA (cytosine1962-C5)-methyltransferase [Patiriisocius sp.]
MNNTTTNSLDHWKDFELIDSGDGSKLERWGSFYLIRPESAAIWKPQMNISKWKKMAHAIFEYNNKRTGIWKKLKEMPNDWQVNYNLGKHVLSFSIELTRFKHVGLFPEQSQNWDYIVSRLDGLNQPKVLNLFAYTGGASLAAKATGAHVTHVDAIKQVITWSSKNMKLSNLDNIRWIVDDALKFAKKENKRESRYDMIILDPPTWGLGPKGEKWKLEDKIHELLAAVKGIAKDDATIIINTYSGLTPVIMENLAKNYFSKAKIDSTELLLPSKTGVNLPTGTVLRIER